MSECSVVDYAHTSPPHLVACGLTKILREMQFQKIYAQSLYLQNLRLDSLSLNSCKKRNVISIIEET